MVLQRKKKMKQTEKYNRTLDFFCRGFPFHTKNSTTAAEAK